MKTRHFLQVSSEIIGKHRYRPQRLTLATNRGARLACEADFHGVVKQEHEPQRIGATSTNRLTPLLAHRPSGFP